MPPSSFPTGLQPIASKDLNGALHRRVSRTDLDFEQALRGEGTFVIKEGLDVDTLGVLDTSLASLSPFSSPSPPPKTPPFIGLQPATPTIVPPTPTPPSRGAPVSSSSSSRLRHRDSSSTSSSNDIFYDAEDTSVQTKRRSMYRAIGTASSPDLATLLRKAKAKEAAGKDGRSKDERRGGTPSHLTADHYGGNTNGSWRTTDPHSQQTTPLSKGKAKATSGVNTGIASPEWVLASPRSLTSIKENGKVCVFSKNIKLLYLKAPCSPINLLSGPKLLRSLGKCSPVLEIAL